jgi:hypothetical protein
VKYERTAWAVVALFVHVCVFNVKKVGCGSNTSGDTGILHCGAVLGGK